MADKAVHHGRNIKRVRELQGIKQEALALELGRDWNQKKVSLLESREHLDDELLVQVAGALQVSTETLKTFSEAAALDYLSNPTPPGTPGDTCRYTFNVMDKIVELYDALLKCEREKAALLEQLLTERKKMGSA